VLHSNTSVLSASRHSRHTFIAMLSWRAIVGLLSACVGLYAVASGFIGPEQQLLGGDRRPNIIVILTDDQDLHMDSMKYMPHTQKLIAEQGTTFNNHFCTVALCCPSRVSLWTGKAAHNTNVTDVNPPHGKQSKHGR